METEAGAAVTRARLLQGATLSSSSEAAPVWFGLKRSVLCPFGICLVLPYVHPEIVPSSPFWD
jgi:hypothetical protein